MSTSVYDFIAIGLGPFNLSLAALTSNIDDLDGLFLEQNSEFNWHPGLMLESAHLQTPFLSDLVTLADPTHPLSFLNYCKKSGRIYAFYIRENFLLMRKEYNQYCRWVIDQLNSILFSSCVTGITYDEGKAEYIVVCHQAGITRTYTTKKLILGTGPRPFIPDCDVSLDANNLLHSTDYLTQKTALQQQSSITLVGGGQSAAEIYYDLLQDIDRLNYQLNWVTRSPRFFPLEYSKLTLEMTSPEYVDYFYALPNTKKDQLNASQKNLYKGINTDLINAIHDTLYIKSLDKTLSTTLITNSRLDKITQRPDNSFHLHCYQQEQQQDFSLISDAVIFATGFNYQPPAFIQGIHDRIEWDNENRYAVKRNYSIDTNNSIFVQNAELHTHGFSTPDLGMACYRNSIIIRELLGFAYYPIEERIAFQTFDAKGVMT